ncbi:MAG: hypothetical protein V2I26_16500 [Halieaceae bacterium]|jgi:hypothetical protein|nr:hypothetical protein [Halieaceae bacterium]
MATHEAGSAAQRATGRSRPALRATAVFLSLLLLPAGLYAFYIVGQLEQIRTHNLQRLEQAASSISGLLGNVRTTINTLYSQSAGSDTWDDGCKFFQRQTRLKLVEPATCTDLPTNDAFGFAGLSMEANDSKLQFVVRLAQRPGWPSAPVADPAASSAPPESAASSPGVREEKTVVVQARLDVLMEQIPFGEAFDTVMIVNNKGMLVGPAISPTRPSVMHPPGVEVPVNSSPVKVFGLFGLTLPKGPDDAVEQLDVLQNATLIHKVELADKRFDLICQPFALPRDGMLPVSATAGADTSAATWHLCGLVDNQRVFRQALTVAPYISVVLLALVTLCIVSWPILKILSLSPHERVRFSDFYLMLVSTLALTMLIAAAIVDVTTYLKLRENSYQRLETLADTIGARLRGEILAMYRQMDDYDRQVAMADPEAVLALARQAPGKSASITDLLLHGRTPGKHDAAGLQLTFPETYRWLDSVFWMRPCDGQQFIKATTLDHNTPAVPLARRNYFQAVKSQRLWQLPGNNGPPPIKLFAETSASVTTGEFFAAVSAPSRLSERAPPLFAGDVAPQLWRDCAQEEKQRFAVALTGRLESLRYPVLAPGVGFVIVDREGKVLVHSDRRRSVYENLLDDAGISARLRATMVADASARLYAQYQTRPHQLFVRPVPDLPWFVVTFVDDEVLRTLHVEVIVATVALITGYLFLALAATFLYILLQGRNPPHWVWPRRHPRFRTLYLWTLWGLGVQLAIFLLSLTILRGWTLLLAGTLLPVPSIVLVVRAAVTANRIPPDATRPPRQFSRQLGWLLASTAGLAAMSIALMLTLDGLSASLARFSGTSFAAALVLLALLLPASATLRRHPSIMLYRDRPPPRWLRRLRDPLTPHTACSVLVWLLVGALPAYGFLKFAFQEEVLRWMQLEQSYVARTLEWRECELADARSKTPVAETPGTSLADPGRPDAHYPQALLLQQWVPVEQAFRNVRDTRPASAMQAIRDNLAKHAPVYNETTTYARYLPGPYVYATGFDGGEAGTWSWQAQASPPVLRYHTGTADVCRSNATDVMGSPVIMAPVIGWWGWLLGIPAGLLLLQALASYCTRKLFFGEIEEEAGAAGTRPPEPGSDVEDPELRDLPDLAWLEAEIACLAPSDIKLSRETLSQWCKTCTTRRSIVDRILGLATPYYQGLWEALSADEKLLLHQLAEEGFANPGQADVVRQLIQRGLLRRDPVLRIMNDSFAVFLKTQLPPAEIKSLEAEGARWHKLRGVMVAALVPLLLFLTFTQRDAVEVWIAYLGTAAAGSAGVLKLLGMLSRSGAEKGAD